MPPENQKLSLIWLGARSEPTQILPTAFNLSSASPLSNPPNLSPAAPLPPSSTPAPNCWHGYVDLHYGRQGDRTQIEAVKTRSPLRLQRPFYPEGGAVCHSVIVHTAGGIVGGDRLDINVTLPAQTQAVITSAAAQKVYRSAQIPAQQMIHHQVESGSWLHWFPQETIVFRAAQYQQQLRVDLAPGAHWVGWDLTRFGRSAGGEVFDQGHWQSQTEVWQGDRPLWIDRQVLAGDAARLHHPHGLNAHAVVGTLVYLGAAIPDTVITSARQQGEQTLKATGCDWGVSQLPLGLIARYRGDSTQAARRWFVAVWDAVRQFGQRRSACPPPVW